jgi:hypothetical protein
VPGARGEGAHVRSARRGRHRHEHYRELRDDAGLVGKRVLLLGRDQLEDLAARKSETVDELERWLAPNLS